jgi:2-polyprenyl-3-methyl-5-hydroxy-6-metoxy-1,4-benzoquinol methylase
VHPVLRKTFAEIEKEWDPIAGKRLQQINDGRDLSYTYILKPSILTLSRDTCLDSVLDVGCGVGTLSLDFAERPSRVLGIDISGESISIARESARKIRNLRFEKASAQSVSARFPLETFSLATANMSLSAMTRLSSAI